MKTSQIRTLVNIADRFEFDRRELFDKIEAGNTDFEISGDGDYRIIADSEIDQIQQDELSSDLYILGCFYDWFLADATGIDIDAIKAIQEAGAYEALGKLVLPHLETIQEEYKSTDGYGHHFSSYDFSEEEVTIDGELYHIFRIG